MSVSAGDRHVPAGVGAAAGAAAYALGYLVTYVWQSASVRESLRGLNFVVELFGGDPIPAWKAVGWLFYNAHFAAFTNPTIAGGRASTNLIASGDAPALLYAVPVLLLVGAGAAVARLDDPPEPDDGALAGATVAVGYLLLALVGVVAFRATRGDATIAVDPVTGVLLAGVVYPLLFGAVGGVLASAFAADEPDRL